MGGKRAQDAKEAPTALRGPEHHPLPASDRPLTALEGSSPILTHVNRRTRAQQGRRPLRTSGCLHAFRSPAAHRNPGDSRPVSQRRDRHRLFHAGDALRTSRRDGFRRLHPARWEGRCAARPLDRVLSETLRRPSAAHRRSGGSVPRAGSPSCRCRAWRVHHWLRERARDFDVAIFPEWLGLAYYVLLAKGQGLAYEGLPVVVNAHGPTAWALEANQQLPDGQEYVDLDFMERECVRRADRIVSPSRWLLEWMRSHQWEISSGRAHVIPNLMPAELRAGTGSAPERQPVRRVVFFGRFEMRKGLKLFCDAISCLGEEERRRLERIVFLGRPLLLPGGLDSRSYIAERSARWGLPVEIWTDKNRDEAVSFLQSPGTLAVMPSLAENSPYTVLECLSLGIPFLASKVGGIPEMIPPEEHRVHLCEPAPQPLADRIAQALTHGIRPASLAWDHATVEADWLSLLRDVGGRKQIQPVPRAEERPLVSVCLVHYNRPQMLAQALDSIRAQTYPNLEVVLVDDGSPDPEAQSFLDGLPAQFEPHGWRIIRQPNLYPGAARNRAAREAKGEFLLFMDDDNIARPPLVETLVHAVLRSGADVMTCALSFFEGREPPLALKRLWIPLGGAVGSGAFYNAFGDANALWRREAFWRIGGYSTDYGVAFEDWELFAEAVLSGLRLEMVPEPLFWYRVQDGSRSRATDSG
ncbi:MAG: glycosyltransferase, partial [Methylacidiphilaceae bacterium]|nr:glycosyltransferase [Candidatus Methylacidiphilaceae bacterium]